MVTQRCELGHGREVAGVDRDEPEVEEPVQVGPKEHPIRDVTGVLVSIWGRCGLLPRSLTHQEGRQVGA